MNMAMSVEALPPLHDLDDPHFNPFEAEALEYGELADTYQRIAEMRRDGDVQKGAIYSHFMGKENEALKGATSYMVFGYDLVFRVLADPDTFSNHAFKQTLGLSFGESLSTMDAPDHPRYRRIFQKAFLPNVVSQWGESVVAPVVDELVSQFEKKGSADLVQDFARHYPFHVIYRQLGLDQEARKRFQKVAVTQTLFRSNLAQAIDAGAKLGDFLRELVERRLARPTEDLVSHLAHAEVDGERLPTEVVVSFFRQLLNAGGDTTYRGTSTILTGLLTHPDQLDAVREDRSLIPQAIEEGLRWEGPAMTSPRTATRDVELDGVTIPKGAIVDAVMGSANRDPAKFSNPDAFDIFRERHARPIPFGTGPHVCIGQHLAKVEISRALTALLDRLPNLRLDPDKPAPVITGFHLRKPKHLHVLFG